MGGTEVGRDEGARSAAAVATSALVPRMPPGSADAARPTAARNLRRRSLAWAELLRLPALFTVPDDALAGAAATAARPNSSFVCLFVAGLAPLGQRFGRQVSVT
ncbi:hypothetical protein GCM10022233_31520 [Streptomyces shaanxiensis]|uniref:Uncharacterized protein n=2 Tax=Streptomyces shaanxiensis TaxID=653357 RepID=A0ABP7V0X4_9ACTN